MGVPDSRLLIPDSGRPDHDPNARSFLSEQANSLIVGRDASDWARRIQADIHALGALEPNWDGYGAPAIDPAVIASAEALVAKLPGNLAPRPRVVPMSNGALQLEWHAGARSLELEFESPHSIRYLRWSPVEGIEEEGSRPATDLETLLNLFNGL
jgi:hypothetical protein